MALLILRGLKRVSAGVAEAPARAWTGTEDESEVMSRWLIAWVVCSMTEAVSASSVDASLTGAVPRLRAELALL